MTPVLWFLSSYAPLWVMLALRFSQMSLKIALLVLALLSTAAMLFFLHRNEESVDSGESITVSGDGGSEVSGYLAAYLLPFLTVSEPNITDGLAYLVFIGVAAVVYIRSDLTQVNPTLYLFGWKVVRGTMPIQTEGARLEKDLFVVSKQDLRVGQSLTGERFSDRVFFDHGGKETVQTKSGNS